MIVFIIDYIERFSFYSRIFPELSKRYDIVVVTPDPLVHLLCKLNHYTSILIKKDRNQNNFDQDVIDSDIKTSVDVLNNDFSFIQAKDNYISTINILDRLFSREKIVKCVIWNGDTLIARASSMACKKRDIDRVYLEISNLPNKMFSDPLGTNAKSSVFFHPEIIDNLESVPNEYHTNWIKYYEQGKKGKLPQSQFKLRIKMMSAVNLALKYCYSSTYKKNFCTIKVKSKLNLDNLKFDNSFCSTRSDGYIFLPLQVSTDTQVKLNSDYSNLDAIDFALKKASELKLKLVVKIHPAERQQIAIDEIVVKQKNSDFILVNTNTIELIKNAKEVIVINSTVGLEALIYNKKITVLGRALYTNFNQERLKKYIHQYLIEEVNYFGKDIIGIEQSEKLLRLKL
ncbi:capsular polysaccharide export protein, LipB/KpsS family [Orbus mooreae]|uniref:capsular polysaccharide export protein, LipB/KpsS family n=1 Tax=Orbus mooreae TaxID=3074107 RepID=UPI00370D5A5E